MSNSIVTVYEIAHGDSTEGLGKCNLNNNNYYSYFHMFYGTNINVILFLIGDRISWIRSNNFNESIGYISEERCSTNISRN
jgi:hypothetical protein